MPLVRYEVRCEHSLANPELYRTVGRDDSEGLLEGVAMAGLVGLVRQLGDLAEFAAEIFHDLHNDITAIVSRSQDLKARVTRLEADLPSVEKSLLAEASQFRFAYTARAQWRASLPINQGQCAQGDLPPFVRNFYEDCRAPPRLFLLDKFDTAGQGACVKRYTDPTFFRLVWATSQLEKAAVAERERKAQEERKKNNPSANGADNGGPHLFAREPLLSAHLENLEGFTGDFHAPLTPELRSRRLEQVPELPADGGDLTPEGARTPERRQLPEVAQGPVLAPLKISGKGIENAGRGRRFPRPRDGEDASPSLSASSDEGASDGDHFVDALTTMESDVESETDSRSRWDPAAEHRTAGPVDWAASLNHSALKAHVEAHRGTPPPRGVIVGLRRPGEEDDSSSSSSPTRLVPPPGGATGRGFGAAAAAAAAPVVWSLVGAVAEKSAPPRDVRNGLESGAPAEIEDPPPLLEIPDEEPAVVRVRFDAPPPQNGDTGPTRLKQEGPTPHLDDVQERSLPHSPEFEDYGRNGHALLLADVEGPDDGDTSPPRYGPPEPAADEAETDATWEVSVRPPEEAATMADAIVPHVVGGAYRAPADEQDELSPRTVAQIGYDSRGVSSNVSSPYTQLSSSVVDDDDDDALTLSSSASVSADSSPKGGAAFCALLSPPESPPRTPRGLMGSPALYGASFRSHRSTPNSPPVVPLLSASPTASPARETSPGGAPGDESPYVRSSDEVSPRPPPPPPPAPPMAPPPPPAPLMPPPPPPAPPMSPPPHPAPPMTPPPAENLSLPGSPSPHSSEASGSSPAPDVPTLESAPTVELASTPNIRRPPPPPPEQFRTQSFTLRNPGAPRLRTWTDPSESNVAATLEAIRKAAACASDDETRSERSDEP